MLQEYCWNASGMLPAAGMLQKYYRNTAGMLQEYCGNDAGILQEYCKHYKIPQEICNDIMKTILSLDLFASAVA